MIRGDIINKDGLIPVHKQIEETIIAQIKNGTLAVGERLPPERALAEKLGLARGTVKQAYDSLALKGYVKSRRGSGTFIQGSSSERRNTARKAVDCLLDEFLEMGYDGQELSALLRTRIQFKCAPSKRVNIAFIDCNPEILSMIRHQISGIESVNYTGFLLKEALTYSNPEEIFGDYDVIITTTSHIYALKAFLPRLIDKIIAVALTVERETLVNLTGIDATEKTLVLTKSKRFAQVIYQNLATIPLSIPERNYCLISAISDTQLAKIIADKKTLVLPPFSALGSIKWASGTVLDFYKSGGEIITFRYAIEKGSLIYVEEKTGQSAALKTKPANKSQA